MNRPCLCTGCPVHPGRCTRTTPRTRCVPCERYRDRERGTRQDRGYGPEHQAARRTLAGTLPYPCGYCGVVVQPDERWVAAHEVDGRPEFGWKVSHPICNERAKRPRG